MAYEYDDMTVPLPPLQELRPEKVRPASETPAAGGVPEPAKGRPVELEESSTRKGGGDLHPTLMPLREVQIDRAPDVRKTAAVDEDARFGHKGKGSVLVPFAVWAVLGIVGVWLYCQLVPLFSFAIGCHGWRLWAALSLLAIPVAVICVIVIYALRLFIRLPRFDQVEASVAESYDLKERLLHGYLKNLPGAEQYARSAGFSGRERDDAVELLRSLRGGGRHYADEAGWLDDFRRFEDLQRSRAKGIIGHYCKMIGFKTAACPWKIIDVICVFANSSLMVADLARLYNRRIGRHSALRLVIRWSFNMYVAGEMGQITESAATAVGGQLEQPVRESLSSLDWLGDGWAECAVGAMPILSKFVGKIAEGGVNAYFAYRMGRKAVADFSPRAQAEGNRGI